MAGIRALVLLAVLLTVGLVALAGRDDDGADERRQAAGLAHAQAELRSRRPRITTHVTEPAYSQCRKLGSPGITKLVGSVPVGSSTRVIAEAYVLRYGPAYRTAATKACVQGLDEATRRWNARTR